MAETKVKTMDDFPSKGKRVIRHGLFWYYAPELSVINGEEKVNLVQHTSFEGEEVELFLQSDIERGERFGAFHPEGTMAHAPGAAPVMGESDAEEGEQVELSDLDDEDLVDWLMSTGAFDGEKKPTATEVVAAAEGDPALAERLLTAEKTASGDDPRKQVESGLKKIAEGGE